MSNTSPTQLGQTDLHTHARSGLFSPTEQKLFVAFADSLQDLDIQICRLKKELSKFQERQQ